MGKLTEKALDTLGRVILGQESVNKKSLEEELEGLVNE